MRRRASISCWRHLRVEQLVVGGRATNGCVELTARDATDHGYEMFLLETFVRRARRRRNTPVLLNFEPLFGTVLQTDQLWDAVRQIG